MNKLTKHLPPNVQNAVKSSQNMFGIKRQLLLKDNEVYDTRAILRHLMHLNTEWLDKLKVSHQICCYGDSCAPSYGASTHHVGIVHSRGG